MAFHRALDKIEVPFDEIYVVNLHGDVKKKEKSPDGTKDENVFDIMQGVAVSIFVKKNDQKDDHILIECRMALLLYEFLDLLADQSETSFSRACLSGHN